MSAYELDKFRNRLSMDLQQAIHSPSLRGLFVELLDDCPGIEMVLVNHETGDTESIREPWH